MTIQDQMIDRLMLERKQAEAMGHRQSEKDSLLLLALLLEDVKRNPSTYARRNS
jgi:hypothetical protein